MHFASVITKTTPQMTLKSFEGLIDSPILCNAKKAL